MKIETFIKQNRDEIIQRIPCHSKDDIQTLKLWIMNDRDLYKWVESKGIKI